MSNLQISNQNINKLCVSLLSNIDILYAVLVQSANFSYFLFTGLILFKPGLNGKPSNWEAEGTEINSWHFMQL